MRRSFWNLRVPFLWLCLCLLWHAGPALSASSDNSLRIGSFNLQVFGQSKVSKTFVKDTFLAILSRYDIVLLQEIRDNDNKAVYDLLADLNQATGKHYQALVSERLGRGEMKEQYAYFYDPTIVSVSESYVFNDVEDKFSREPFIARFSALGRTFTLAGIHVAPTDVVKELKALNDVYVDAKNHFHDNSIFIMGDFNADCGYYKADTLGFDYYSEKPRLLISNEEDTTVAPTSCAYDRVLAFGAIQNFASDAHAFNFMKNFNYDLTNARLISDHFPIEFNITTVSANKPAAPLPPPAEQIPSEGTDSSAESSSGAFPSEGMPEESTDPTENPVPAPLPSPTPTLPAATCGIDVFSTTAGYCYGYFAGAKKRVTATCCY